MAEEPLRDIVDLYFAAAAIDDPVECDDYVREQCGADHTLAEKLRGMLQVREEAEQLFEAKSDPSAKTLPMDLMLDLGADFSGLGEIANFRIEKLIGRGGMGNVFLAFDMQLRRPVALKFPRVDTLHNPQLLERFLQEARLAAQLNHPNLVKIYQVDVLGKACFIASEWCEGGDLARWLAANSGAQEPRWSAALIAAIARAVAYCHRQKVVHLDIKPANIIMAKLDTDHADDSKVPIEHAILPFRPMLTDFGVAKVVEEGLTQTHSSLMMGTPMYMAPEQAECDRSKTGPLSDIFALGVVLHELLYGERPFEGDSPLKVMDKLRSSDTLVLPKSNQVPQELRTICSRCLQHAPEDRYPSADALAEDLDRFLRHEPIHARPVSLTQRLKRWSMRPQRIAEAFVVTIVIQLVLSAWVLLGICVAGSFLDGTELLAARLEMSMTIFFISTPLVLLSYLAIHGRRWATYTAFLLSLVGQVVVPGLALAGVVSMLQSLYDQQPYFQMINMGLVLFAGLTQTFLLGVAISALKKKDGANVSAQA